eukprot:2885246-Karenia_brevis.AAC.1
MKEYPKIRVTDACQYRDTRGRREKGEQPAKERWKPANIHLHVCVCNTSIQVKEYPKIRDSDAFH